VYLSVAKDSGKTNLESIAYGEDVMSITKLLQRLLGRSLSAFQRTVEVCGFLIFQFKMRVCS